MSNVNRVQFFSGENVPLEMHKVRMVQRIHLPPVEDRLGYVQEAGNNTFLLRNRDVYLDMLTDSGVNAMSEAQYAAMPMADDVVEPDVIKPFKGDFDREKLRAIGDWQEKLAAKFRADMPSGL